jgi:aromatic amino acid permease
VDTARASAPTRRFKTRHLSMMALGSAIGAGFFLGTGQAVAQAGPAVLVSYAIAAGIAVVVMYALAELASAMPSSGSFSTYAESGIGRWAGFTVGWLYWFTLIMVLGMESTGAAEIVTGWFPEVPQWTVALVIVVILGGVNLLAAGDFGEVEAWLAGIKVAAIVMFLLVGVGLVVGLIPGREEAVGQTLLGHGGFAPRGLAGVAAGLLAIITSFGGLEIVTIASAEAEDAQRAMGRAIRSVIWRILVFYVGSVVLMVCLLPWDSEEMETNPFGSILGMAGVPAVARIMEAVVLVALVSAFSANIYASSRMAYSLSARGMGVRWLLGGDAAPSAPPVRPSGDEDGARPSLAAAVREETATGDIARGRTPRRAVWVSIVLALVSVALNWLLPETLLGLLINAIGMTLLIVWVFIIVSQLRLHESLDRSHALVIRMPGGRAGGRIALVALAGMGVLMAWSPVARPQLVSMLALTGVIVVIYVVRQQVALTAR